MSDNLADHMKHLLVGTAQFAAQVHFLLLLAHKNALVSASEVFEAMFRFDRNNGKAENGSADRPVEVPDVGAAAFKVMLSFIHTEELSGLDGDNATEVLYAAVKYNISGLIGHCLAALPNAFLALAHARLFGLEEFANKYIRYIYKNGGPLFGTEEFLQIDQNLLSEIFDRDQLMISDEFEIWKAALRWADEKCRQNAIECSAENRRSALGPALFKIRFPLIPTDTFEKQIVPSGVLSNDECVAISQFHSHYRPNLRGVPGLKPLKFPTQTRICDWNIAKANGAPPTLAFEIEKLSEFAREEEGSVRESALNVCINGGFQCYVSAKISTAMRGNSTEKWLGLCLGCCAASEDEKYWSCKCSATYRIISQKSGTEDLIGKYYDLIFNNDKLMYGFVRCISFAELMDPRKGFYDQNEDKVTCAIDVFMEEENRAKFDSDPNKSNGTIVMEIGKLSEFAREICSSARHSEAIQLNGLSWEIAAKIETDEESAEKCLGFYLRCTAPTNDGKWSCKCSATYRIVSQKRGTEDLIGKYYGLIFNNDKHIMYGFGRCISFAELMDPRKGFYDQNEDKMTCVIDVFMEEEKSKAKFDSDPNKSNGTIVMEIDKLSEFAREFCLSKRRSETIQLKGLSWELHAKIFTMKSTEKWLRFYLMCTTPTNDGKWSRKCSATYRIVSQKSGTEDLIRRIYGHLSNNVYSNRFGLHSNPFGFIYFISFAELMDPRKGFYDQNEDKLTCAIDVFMEEENRGKFDSDPNKSNGTIVMEIGKLSEFAREICSSARHSEAIQLKGLSWEIAAEIETYEESAEKCLGFYLMCTAPTNDGKWSCKCSATYRIVSQKRGTEDLIGKYYDRIFNNDDHIIGFDCCISFAELMDPRKGFYDQNEDKMTCVIDVFMEEEKSKAKFDSDPNKSNGTIVMEIDKLSEFAREFCLSERCSETIQLKGLSWDLHAKIDMESTEKWLRFYLICTAPTNDGKWTCKCSATLRIVSQKRGTDDFVLAADVRCVYGNNEWDSWHYDHNLISFSKLMDPSEGFYNKHEDKVTFAIDLIVRDDEWRGGGEMPTKQRCSSDTPFVIRVGIWKTCNGKNGIIMMENDCTKLLICYQSEMDKNRKVGKRIGVGKENIGKQKFMECAEEIAEDQWHGLIIAKHQD
ncbi:hypothetical protein niasHS_011539 [Heterodera schachtii]|uniref:BTB domain-containing protein n=1 Tax=Heterodera schachtii TaxID=97005 RepID=A0ABD2IFN6_HETSC